MVAATVASMAVRMVVDLVVRLVGLWEFCLVSKKAAYLVEKLAALREKNWAAKSVVVMVVMRAVKRVGLKVE